MAPPFFGRLSSLIYFRTKAAAPWCHLICFFARLLEAPLLPPSPDGCNGPSIPPPLLAFAFSLGLEGFFRWAVIRYSHHVTALLDARIPAYFASATLCHVKFAGIVAPGKGLCQDGIQPKNSGARNTAGIQSALLTLEKTGCTMCATRQGS